MNDSLTTVKSVFEGTEQSSCRVYLTSSPVIILLILFQTSEFFDRIPSIGDMILDMFEAPDLSFDWGLLERLIRRFPLCDTGIDE